MIPFVKYDVIARRFGAMLSIVVPVYNAEKELGDCLDRILAQKNADYELIVIDDGSKDNSCDVIDAYAAKYPQIRVIKQENQGITTTRRIAAEAAHGEYIWYLDDDDVVSEGAFAKAEELLREHPETDILWFGFTVDFLEEGYSFPTELPDHIYTSSLEAVQTFFQNDSFNMYWNKLYRVSMLRAHPEAFPHRKDQSGDLIFNCVSFSYAKMVQASSFIAYHYQKREKESMVNRFLEGNDVILHDKKQGVKDMMRILQAKDDPLVANYFLREYEVFVINLFAKDCPYSKEEKIRMIQDNILDPESIEYIEKAVPADNKYSGIFKKTAMSRNAKHIYSTYAFLSFAKNHFSGLYQKFRRSTYQK